MTMKNDCFQRAILDSILLGPRRESRRTCADRLLKFLKRLRHIDPVFKSNWFGAGERPEDPRNKPVVLDSAALDSVLKKGIHKTDYVPGSLPTPIRDLGFSVCLVSDGYHRVSLWIQCGGHTKLVDNSIIIQLPNSGVAGGRVFSIPTLTRIFDLIVHCWNPDVGQVWSSQMSDAIGESNDDLQVGWLTYVASRTIALPTLDSRFQRVPIGRVGHVFVATKQRFNVDHENHVARLKHLSSVLKTKSKKRTNKK